MAKILLCLLVSIAWVQAKKFELVSPPQELVPDMLKTGETCMVESGAEANIFEKFMQGTYNSDLSTKKFVYCFFVKGNYVDSDGYLKKENVMPVVGSHKKAKKLGKVVEQCNEEVREANYEDKYDKALALINCLHHNTPLKLKLN